MIAVCVQGMISSSAGEVEFHTLVKCARRLPGITALFPDLGISLKFSLRADANAGIGIAPNKEAIENNKKNSKKAIAQSNQKQ